jgi:hypothetical protein
MKVKITLCFLMLLALAPASSMSAAEPDEVKMVLALQAAEIQKLKDELKRTTLAVAQAQATANTAQSIANSKPGLANACVISPNWMQCPEGFSNHGNFYACFPQGSGLGVDATGMPCGGPYDDRHVTVCCRP